MSLNTCTFHKFLYLFCPVCPCSLFPIILTNWKYISRPHQSTVLRDNSMIYYFQELTPSSKKWSKHIKMNAKTFYVIFVWFVCLWSMIVYKKRKARKKIRCRCQSGYVVRLHLIIILVGSKFFPSCFLSSHTWFLIDTFCIHHFLFINLKPASTGQTIRGIRPQYNSVVNSVEPKVSRVEVESLLWRSSPKLNGFHGSLSSNQSFLLGYFVHLQNQRKKFKLFIEYIDVV